MQNVKLWIVRILILIAFPISLCWTILSRIYNEISSIPLLLKCDVSLEWSEFLSIWRNPFK